MENSKRFVTITGGRVGVSVNRGNVGKAMSCVAKGGRCRVGTRGGEDRLSSNASGTGRSSCRYD